jgi:hypothetical protein
VSWSFTTSARREIGLQQSATEIRLQGALVRLASLAPRSRKLRRLRKESPHPEIVSRAADQPTQQRTHNRHQMSYWSGIREVRGGAEPRVGTPQRVAARLRRPMRERPALPRRVEQTHRGSGGRDRRIHAPRLSSVRVISSASPPSSAGASADARRRRRHPPQGISGRRRKRRRCSRW